MTELRLLRHGVVPYGQALTHQLELRERLRDGEDHAGWLVCLQHSPVVTLGKRGRESDIVSPDSLRDRGVELFRVDRGGEATYHGPGQLVVYPILRLDDLGLGIVDLVRGLATSLGDTIEQEFGLQTVYDTDHPGLWTTEEPQRKIGSVGMRVSRGVSMHGAALNVVNDMIPFSWIVACGMPNAPMTRLQDYVADPIDLDAFTALFLDEFAARFGVELVEDDEPLPPGERWQRSLPLHDDATNPVDCNTEVR